MPQDAEIANCAPWLEAELQLQRPRLVIPVGKLAIAQFMAVGKLETVIGRAFLAERAGVRFDLVPLPHPSGASPWPRIPPGSELTARALRAMAAHLAMQALR